MRREKSIRLLALASGASLALGVVPAAAQTVHVHNAAPKAEVEVVLGSTQVANGAADEKGEARLTLGLPLTAARPADLTVVVDRCGSTWRVVLVEQGLQAPAPSVACSRTAMPYPFRIARTSTLFVDVLGATPTVLLSQGPAPPEWLGLVPIGRRIGQTGLMVSVGGGLGHFGSVVANSCGDLRSCSGSSGRQSLAVGATYWFTPNVAADVSYLKSANVNVRGSGDRFRFTHQLETDVLTVTGKFGAQVEAFRFYGVAGMSRHAATYSSTEFIQAPTPDGSLGEEIPWNAATGTGGWGLTLGGGFEAWVASRVALYFEGGRTPIKGNSSEGQVNAIDDRLLYFLGGVRLRLTP